MPRQLEPILVLKDPRLIFFHDFLTVEEVDHLITLAVGRWLPSTLFRGTCMEVTLDFAETAIVEHIEARVAEVTGFPVSHVEQLELVRYQPGEFCEVHHDGAFRPMTVFVCLSDVSKGGKMEFPVRASRSGRRGARP